MTELFKPHGKCAINIKNNIIVVDAEGPWNMEFVHQLHKDLITAIKKINDHYCVLLVPYGEALVVNEGIECHINFLKSSYVSAVAINLQHVFTPSLSKSLCEKVYQDAGVRHNFFTCNDLAEEWLLSHLKN